MNRCWIVLLIIVVVVVAAEVENSETREDNHHPLNELKHAHFGSIKLSHKETRVVNSVSECWSKLGRWKRFDSLHPLFTQACTDLAYASSCGMPGNTREWNVNSYYTWGMWKEFFVFPDEDTDPSELRLSPSTCYDSTMHDRHCKSLIYKDERLLKRSLGEEICNALHSTGFQSIIFVGDSLNEEFFITFMSVILHGVEGGADVCKTVRGPFYQIIDEFLICGNITARTIRNDYLTADRRDPCPDMSCAPFWNHINLLKTTLLVVNRGAHVDFSVDDTIQQLSYFFNSTAHENITVVFRSTAPFHTLETNISQPWVYEDQVVRSKPSYHYRRVFQDLITFETLIKTAAYPHVFYLDIFAPTSRRSDLHKDFLHYCIPGPIDTWVVQLYNLIDLVRDVTHTCQHQPSSS